MGKGKKLVSGCSCIFSISFKANAEERREPDTNIFPFPNILYTTNFRAKLIRIKSVLNQILKRFVSMTFFLGLANKKFAEAFSAIFPNVFLNTNFRAKCIRIKRFLNIIF